PDYPKNEVAAGGDITIVRPPAAAPTRRPEQVEMRRAGIAATTRQGIKNTSSPAGNVGERARRSPRIWSTVYGELNFSRHRPFEPRRMRRARRSQWLPGITT